MHSYLLSDFDSFKWDKYLRNVMFIINLQPCSWRPSLGSNPNQTQGVQDRLKTHG